MKIGIISGSNRANSGSRKVADYCEHYLTHKRGSEVVLLDMHEVNLPMWSEDLRDSESAQAQNWAEHKAVLADCDAYVVTAAEWNGTIPPSLQNIIMHLDRDTVGHKPALLVGVSAGRGGAYPIAELKTSINKNNRLVLIPDYVIVRGVGDVFDDVLLDESRADDYYIKSRTSASLDELELYTKHLGQLRAELAFDYSRFTHGM